MTIEPRVLAVASAGGHLVQLCRLMPSWRDCELTFLTTDGAYQAEIERIALKCGLPPPQVYVTVEANRWQKGRLFLAAIQIGRILLEVRPDVIVTTGAAPGYLAIRLGGLLGARTVWIDSIANCETLSLSGMKAGIHADLWLTQWEHLATPDGPLFKGSVL